MHPEADWAIALNSVHGSTPKAAARECPLLADSECPAKVRCFAIGADDDIDDKANGGYGSCDSYRSRNRGRE
jgi:hypothetical protein